MRGGRGQFETIQKKAIGITEDIKTSKPITEPLSKQNQNLTESLRKTNNEGFKQNQNTLQNTTKTTFKHE